MAHSIITYSYKHEMFSDLDLLIVIQFALNEWDSSVTLREECASICSVIDAWRGTLKQYIPGCIELGFDTPSFEATQAKCMRHLFACTAARIESMGTVISGEAITAMVGDTLLVFGERQSADLLVTISRLVALIE